MIATPPPASLAERIAQAIRDAAYDCPGDCGLDERDCDAQHPIQVAACHWSTVASVYGDIDALAATVLPTVEAEVVARDAEITRLRAELADARTPTS